MKYDLSVVMENKTFDEAIVLAVAELAKKGFGILSNVDMKHVIKSKINKNIPKYVILGACNPKFAYTLIKDEDLIGLFLPCNVLIQELDNGNIKISIINPESFIDIVNDPRVASIILSVKEILTEVIEGLKNIK